MARTDTLGHFLTDVADAIRTKTGESGTIQASAFDTAISNIPSGGGKYTPRGGQISFASYTGNELDYEVENLDTQYLKTFQNMFMSCYNIISLDLSDWDTSQVNNLSGMFSNCTNLTSVDLSGFDTDLVTTMNSMFSSCNKITSIDLSDFDTTATTTTSYMFSGCKKLENITFGEDFTMSEVTNTSGMFSQTSELTTIDLSNMDLTNVTNANTMFSYSGAKTITLPQDGFDNSTGVNCQEMFRYCYLLETINNLKISKITNGSNMFGSCRRLASIDLSNVYPASNFNNMSNMFNDCMILQFLDIRNFDLGNITSYSNMLYYVPTTCEIIVKDAASKTWMQTNFASYTNVKTVAEYEAE